VALDASPRIRLSGGVRWDGVDDSGFGASTSDQRAWSPRAGIVVHLTDPGSTTVFAQISRAFKVPTLDQLFDPRPYPDFRGGTFTISNPNLVPQRATNVEAGVSGRVDTASIRWSALAYHMMVDDEIDFDVRTFSYANIGESRHTGFEAEVEGQWWKRVRPSLAYALTRVVDAEGDLQLKNVPKHVVAAAAAIDGPWAIGATIRFYHTGGAFLDDQNAYPIDGPATLDFRIRRPVAGHTLFLDVFNATNNVYEEYGLTLTDFRGRVVPYVYPGAPRAIRAGVTFSLR
jgi:outer membrane receptor protein involved in Fe transport